ncbi:SPRY-domain-containing protein [Imleria badia]|nr:SPRY-domain-containing protein [Imleria badia]
MSTRHPRSSTIPVRAVPASPARHIESVISIPLSASPTQSRPRIASQGWPPRNSQGAIGIPYGVRGNSSITSSPPARPTSRSFTHPSVLSARSSPSPYTVYEPRVIRADSTRTTDAVCPHNPSTSSGSPGRTRRPSSPSIRAHSAQRPSIVTHISAPAEPVPFHRPAYLEHSALRHLLQTEPSPLIPPRKAEPIVRQDPRRVQRSPSYDSDEDDMSPPREFRKSTPSPMTASSPTLLLPARWCDEYRSPHLSICGDGRELIYQRASAGSDKDAATARTAVPVPPACGIFYYEVEITSKASKSRTSVGFIGRDVKISRLPGWEKNSWGYHGESGTICSGDKNGTPFGTTFGVGDVIGCGIDFTQNKIFYTKNGSLLGTVFENVGKECDIFPAVGLCYTNESIHANFGQETFKYDIEDHVLQQRNYIWAKIQSTPLTWPTEKLRSHDVPAFANNAGSIADPSEKIPLNDLVLSYLSHHGYAHTARTFESQCRARGGLSARAGSVASAPEATTVTPAITDDYVMDMDIGDGPSTASTSKPAALTPIPADDIELRTHIIQSVVSGDVDTALTATRKHFPLVLQADAGLMLFKLRCRKFVELVLEAAELKKKMTAEDNEMNVEGCGPVSRSVSGSGLESVSEDAVGSDGGVIVDGVGMDIDDGEAESDTPYVSAHTEMSMPTSSAPIAIGPRRKRSVVSLSSTSSWAGATAAQYGSALEKAVTYGQELESDYKNRAEVRAIFKRTSVIMAYDDPLQAGGDAAEVAGQAARVVLATELNQAILQSQGRPAQPLLDRLYRQTAVCLTQLALMGNGAAAFADMPKEFLDA